MAGIWVTPAAPYWSYFGRRLVRIAGVRGQARVLDVGSGRGTSLFPAAERAGPGGWVVGIDNWWEHARGVSAAIRARGVTQAAVVAMDAGRLAFCRDWFDWVVSGFAYVFFSLGDARRWLREGGQIAISSWEWQEDSEWMGEVVGAKLGETVPRVYHRDSRDGLREQLEEAGYRDVRVIAEGKGFVYRDEEEWWRVMGSSGWQGYLERIAAMGSDTLEEVKSAGLEKARQHGSGGGIHFRRDVLFGLGRK